MEIFNTREIAIITWSLVAFVAVLFFRSIRESIGQLLKILFSSKLMIIYLLMVGYIFLSVYILHLIGFWEKSLIKDTIKWVLFVASVTFFQIKKYSEDKKFYRNTIKEILKITLIIEFLTDLYTFNLLAELTIMPVAALVGGMMAVTQREEKHKSVHSCLNKVVGGAGILILSHTLYMTIVHYKDLFSAETLKNILLSPILTLSLLPFVYCLSIFMKYEVCFATMRFGSLREDLIPFAKKQAVFQWRTDIEGLERWKRKLPLFNPETKDAIQDSIQQVKMWQRTEHNPPKILIEDGWSPYTAREFVSGKLQTGYYEPAYGSLWSAKAPNYYFGDSWISNSMKYEILGSKDIAYNLRLVLNVFTPGHEDFILPEYLDEIQILFKNALNQPVPNKLAQSILSAKSYNVKLNGYQISLYKNLWGNSTASYDLILDVVHGAKPPSMDL